MFYILERKEEGNILNQFGVVVADSIEDAAAKVEMKITECVKPPESAVVFVNLEDSYMLTEFPEITSVASIPKRKIVDKLMYIATTHATNWKRVMPRIHCVDGVSLSVQASRDHYSSPKGDLAPFTALEVGFLTGAEYPKEWSFIENHRSALSSHDHTGVDIDAMMPFVPIYTVDLVVLKKFIEDHGGEKQ